MKVLKYPSLESLRLAQRHPRWPAMKRARDDRATLVCDSCVWRWYADVAAAQQVAMRSQQEPLRGYCGGAYEYVADGWVQCPYVIGREATAADVLLIDRELQRLHDSGPRQRMRVGAILRSRVLARLLNNHAVGDPMHDEIAAWPMWRYIDGSVGPWHGDPSLTNVLITPSGAVQFIDHSPMEHGPREYDFAKLRRSLVLGDDGEWKNRPPRGDEWLAVVVAGMIGSHCAGAFRDKLIEMWRTIIA